MKRLILSVMVMCGIAAASEGERIYESKCAECHVRHIPVDRLMENFMKQDNTLLNLKAPTLNQVAFRLRTRIGDPTGDEEFHLMEVQEFVKDYSFDPDKQKSVCLPEVIKHFPTKPNMTGKVTEEELDIVTEWIYRTIKDER